MYQTVPPQGRGVHWLRQDNRRDNESLRGAKEAE